MRRGLRASFVLSRMTHARLLVGAVLAAILIVAALLALEHPPPATPTWPARGA